MPTRSDTFSTGHVMTTCGDGLATEYLEFGFRSVGVRVYNSCGPRLFYSFDCTPSTAQDFIACGASETFKDMHALGIGLRTTSTSTAGGAVARPVVGVSAWASA